MGSDEDYHSCENTFPKSPVGTLIARISNMLKKPVIDTELNETLDSFLDELNESQRYLSHGIFNVKFAEAGLFLQNAVALYGKKVDSLWDSTLQYQMQLCSYTKPSEENEHEAAVITQRLNRNKRKKLALLDSDGSNSLYENLNTVCDKADEFLRRKCSAVQFNGESSQCNTLLNDHSSDSALSAVVTNDSNQAVCDFRFPVESSVNNLQTGEKLCNYSDLYLNCVVPFLETSKLSVEDVDSSECLMTTRKNDWLLQKYVIERHLTYKQFWTQLRGDDFELFRRAHQQEACNVETNIRSSLDKQARNLCPQEFVVKLPRLPDELMIEYVKSNNVHVKELIQDILTKEKDTQETVNPVGHAIKKGSERISNADSLFPDATFDDSNNEEALSKSCDNNLLLSQRSSADSGICLSEGLALSVVMDSCADLINNNEDLPNNGCSNTDIVGSLVSGQLGSESFSENNSEQIVENIGRNEYVVDSLDGLENNDEDIVTGIKNLAKERIPATPVQITVVHKSNLKPLKDANIERKNLKRKLLQEDNSDNKWEKRKKIQTRFRWLKTTTTMLATFEKFFKHNYQPEFGEGDIVEDESEEEIESGDVDAVPPTAAPAPTDAVLFNCAHNSEEEDRDSTVSTIDLNNCSSGYKNNEDLPDNSSILQTVLAEANTTSIQKENDLIVNSAELNVSNNPVNKIGNLESEGIERLKAVTEWKKFIEPKLKEAEQSAKFDIHQYGTRIMDAIPAESNLNFNNLAAGKSPSEVSRLFLASLQLANTYNVELVGAQQGELANEKLEIKLLSRERYHEHLDEYEAPSENSFREKFARLQALQPSQRLHSTPSKSCSSVKYKRKHLS